MGRAHSKARYSWALVALLVIAVAGIFFAGVNIVKADSKSITIQEINYTDSTITLKANAGDSIIYFSDKSGKTWEAVPGELGPDQTITMDISWISVSSSYTLRFKGDVSTSMVSVVIPRQATNFRAAYNKVKGTVAFTNQVGRTVQWRKKDSYLWNTVDIVTFPNELEMLCTQGATLYLRLAPTNGFSAGDTLYAGERPSKEVLLSVPKKTTAPTINIDGSKFLIPATKNMSYRTVRADGTLSDWITVTNATNLLLKDIAGNALYTDSTTIQSEVTLQFRKNATSSSQVSHIASVTIPIQEKALSEEENGISIEYTSSASLNLTIKAASSTKPFEYTIVKKDEKLDYLTANWVTVSSPASILISKTSAPEGSYIYVRKKSIAADGDIKFALASKETNITGSNGVCYPNAATANNLTT